MSDHIKHECGIALVRLLKPLSYYQEKYGTALYGMNKLKLLMQKQRNRGQDGAGLATIKLDVQPGNKFISRKRSNAPNYLSDLFKKVYWHFEDLTEEQLSDTNWLKTNKPYMGEVLLGHLRYGTHGDNSIETCHPYLRRSNWITRNLVLAGNFNLTNVDELISHLFELGQYPKERSDTVTILEKMGHFLDEEVERLFQWYRPEEPDNTVINRLIFDKLDVNRVLSRASRKFDGGYVMGGIIGHGDAFIMRDPTGIRPAYYYQDDEIFVAASERPAIQTTLNVNFDSIKEVIPGESIVVKHNGEIIKKRFIKEIYSPKPCSFERIYFSRGNDRDIYLERKKLGEILTDKVLETIDYDLEHTVFSFIPNTAETSFLGLIQGIEKKLNQTKLDKILNLKEGKNKEQALKNILTLSPRVEKIVVKDAKLRTFIADTSLRGDMISHVYDVTYGIVKNGIDTLVLLDDSIVRGATMKDSIIQIVARLKPKKIIIVSSAPQIRYPDCYGIDMSKLNEFVAFRAMIELLQESNQSHLLQEAYERAKKQESLPTHQITNELQALYDLFPYDLVSKKIGELLTPANIEPEVSIIYQDIQGVNSACPNNNGDWYFSGNYPTPGGNKVVNRAFIYFMEGIDKRAY